jgi:hypothetical protein
LEPEGTSIARQQLGKQVSAAKDKKATTENLLGIMLSIRSVQSDYKEDFG